VFGVFEPTILNLENMVFMVPAVMFLALIIHCFVASHPFHVLTKKELDIFASWVLFTLMMEVTFDSFL